MTEPRPSEADAPSYLDRKRREIILCAKRRFMQDGYASTGMEAVARDAGVSTATVYTLFSGKAALFQEVVAATSGRFSRLVEDRLAALKDGRERLDAFALVYAEFTADPFVQSVYRLLAAESRRFESVAQDFYTRMRRDFGAALLEILAVMSRQGAIATERPSWAAGQLMGMIEHPTLVVALMGGESRRSAADVAADAVRTFMCRYGLGEKTGLAPGAAVAARFEQEAVMETERAIAPELDA